MYRYRFYDLKVHFWWPDKRLFSYIQRWNTLYTNYGHPERVFFQKIRTFGLKFGVFSAKISAPILVLCLIFQFYLMYRLICLKPAYFLSAQMALVNTFFQMFIVLGMYNYGVCKRMSWDESKKIVQICISPAIDILDQYLLRYVFSYKNKV